jgi:hypothetical protein
MMERPLRCVVDTNVATTANGANPGAPLGCVAASAKILQDVMTSGHVFLDDGRRILDEYLGNLSVKGQRGAGDVFLKWLLTHEWNSEKVTRVVITSTPHDDEDFHELPSPLDGTFYDRSDRKFLAVAAAHPDHPPILQSFDSKWVGWTTALESLGVTIHFLCPEAIRAKYAEKMG